MVSKKIYAVALSGAVLFGVSLIGEGQAAQVVANNRLKVDCTLEAPNISIPLEAKSKQSITIADVVVDNLQVVCKGNKLDKETTTCKQMIGGTGGSGIHKDEGYDLKYVKEIHVYAQVNMFLVCSFM